MPVQDTQSPAPGSAAWIERYANGLINQSPGMHPLDAVRMAMMDATCVAASKQGRPPSNPDVRDARR
jgi:hypothetical protein